VFYYKNAGKFIQNKIMLQIQNNTSIIALFPFEFFAVFGIALGLIFFSYYAREKSTGRLANGYAILLLFLLIIVNHYNSQEIITLYQDSFIVDSFSKYGKTFLCILTIICLIVSENYLIRAKMTFE
jgi:NADH:ubiquinone oxidoreductase subunit 2 (subunit N)